MPDADLTSINVILDESGSMAQLEDDTIGGFNTFLRRQREVGGRATMSLTKFSTTARVIYTSAPLEQIGDLSKKTYTPGGGTALLDAIAKTVNAVRSSLTETPEEERPAKVIFLIITDGAENSSVEFGKRTVTELIRERREQAGWEFVFMGANIDAFAEAQALGIAPGNSLRFGATPQGTSEMYSRMSDAMTSYRSQSESRVADYFEHGESESDPSDPSKKKLPH